MMTQSSRTDSSRFPRIEWQVEATTGYVPSRDRVCLLRYLVDVRRVRGAAVKRRRSALSSTARDWLRYSRASFWAPALRERSSARSIREAVCSSKAWYHCSCNAACVSASSSRTPLREP